MQKRLSALSAAVAAGMVIAACSQMEETSEQPSRPSINVGPIEPTEKLMLRAGAVLPAAATQGIAAADAVHAHPAEIRLWSGPAPGSENQTTARNRQLAHRNRHRLRRACSSFPTVTNIHVPSITPYLPEKSKATGAAVIIAPGGGHMFLTINHEGYDLAKYFADRGVAAFVLKYRLPRSPAYPANTYTIAETVRADSVRAVRLVRSRAAEWGLNPDAIGVSLEFFRRRRCRRARVTSSSRCRESRRSRSRRTLFLQGEFRSPGLHVLAQQNRSHERFAINIPALLGR